MAYQPISGIVPQISKDSSGNAANGYYLKGYASGTTTPLSMGTDITPTATLAKCKLNSRGEPISNDTDETTVFIPHFNAAYKIALYDSSADADANTIANAVWVVDLIDLAQASTINGISINVGTYLTNKNIADYAALRALASASWVDGDTIQVTNDGIAGDFVVKTGTVTDNGGTLIVFTDDANRYAQRASQDGYAEARWFGAAYDGSTDDTAAHNAALLYLCSGEGGFLQLGLGDTVISSTLRDDIANSAVVGKTIIMAGYGSTEDPTNSGKVTNIKTTGAMVGIQVDGNRTELRNFTITGDGGAADGSSHGIVLHNSRGRTINVVSTAHRGDGLLFQFGNLSHFESILCISNAGNGLNLDGTGYVTKAAVSRPNDLNACTFVNIEGRANGLIGIRTGENSGFSNFFYGMTAQSNTGVGIEVNGNYHSMHGVYSEANDIASVPPVDFRYGALADNNKMYGYFSNQFGAGDEGWEDLSSAKSNAIDNYKTASREIKGTFITVGENNTVINGHLLLDGEGDGTNTSITLEGTSGSQTLDIYSSGAGTLKLNPTDGIVLEASTAPTLLNSWVDYGGSRKVAGYYKDPFGIVHLEGVIKSGTATPSTALFTLPAGYRPTARERFSTTEGGAAAGLFVDSDGNVYIEYGSNAEFSLSGVSFRT